MNTDNRTRNNGARSTNNYFTEACSPVQQRPRQRRIPSQCSLIQQSKPSNRISFNVFTVLVVFISFLSVVSATEDLPQHIARKRLSFADLGARRLMERATPTAASTKTTASASAISSPTSTVLPQAFDTTLGNNFTTTSCPQFLVQFLQDADFVNCHAFSMLLQTSHGFFEAEKNFYEITNVMQASCTADFNTCNAKMQDLATKLKSDDACGQDYVNENQIVMQAYNGLLAYEPMYQAGCLKDPEGDYCFADAITLREGSSLADAYLYYLPLGTSMPIGTRPSCNPCLKYTMNIFRTYASNNTQPVSSTYTTAAQQINMACGPEWVSDSIQTASKSGSPQTIPWSSTLALILTFSLAIFLS